MAFLKTANDDKSLSTNPLVSFDVNQDVTVYVAYAGSDYPTWLSGWNNTGDDLVNTDRSMKVLSKDFPAGTVTLGPNGTASSMYIVLVGAKSGPTVESSTGIRTREPASLVVFPNPFKNSTELYIKNSQNIKAPFFLKIYDISGKLIRDLSGQVKKAGPVIWNSADNPSGIYIVQAMVGCKHLSKHIILSK
jgi:hypothetical protein